MRPLPASGAVGPMGAILIGFMLKPFLAPRVDRVIGPTLLREDQPLLFDFGASYGGYNADITRTVFCEYASEEHELFYNTVLAANALGREISAPGLTCDDLDNRVTDVLRASPFAKFVVHKTGHGLGLDVHEAPQVMAGNFTALEDGMVITIEPGIYYPEKKLGIRIEDVAVVRDGYLENLTDYPTVFEVPLRKAP